MKISQTLKKQRFEKNTLVKIAVTAMFCAIAILLMYVIRIPFPALPFLVYDPADIPIIICTFLFGPAAGLINTVIVSIIQMLTASSDGLYGGLMHIIATGTYVLTAGLIYKYHRTLKGALVALCCGTLAWVVVMIVANLIITPLFMGVPTQAVAQLLIPSIIPFNLLKAGINSILAFILYKSISTVVKRILS